MDEAFFSKSGSSSQKDDDLFKPFTYMSYQELVERDIYLKEQEHNRARHAQEAHLVDGELKFGSQEDDDRLPPENSDLKDGNMFTKMYGNFPESLVGIPIEELDPGIREKTFVVISSRFWKKYISRYTATKSLFLFAAWNPVRKVTLFLSTHQFFDLFIFTTIIINCVFLAMPTLLIAETMEYVFLAIYTLECIIKVVARGFIFNKNTYLRDPWNWLDFTVINTAFFTILLQQVYPVLTVGNLRGLRTFRVLRALKTVSIVPGLRTIVNALLRAFKMLFEVILLTIFCLMVFAMFGLQLYMGVLRQKCVLTVDGLYDNNSFKTFDDYYLWWIKNPDHWYSSDDEYVICGNVTGAGLCPTGYTCLPNLGDNPRYGFLNFDHIGWALLSCFQLITLDFWEDIYNKILTATGPWNVLYFIITIFFGAFYLINLMLAVVSLSYEEESLSAVKEREREKKDSARKKHNAMYDVSFLQMKAKLQAATLAKITTNEEIQSDVVDSNTSAGQIKALTSENQLTNYKHIMYRRTTDIIMSESILNIDQPSGTIIKADYLLDPEIGFLGDRFIDRNCDCCEHWICKYPTILKAQNYFYVFVSDPLFELFITFCIVFNTIFMSLEHYDQPAVLTDVLVFANYIFLSIFTIEACTKIFGLGKYYFVVGWNIFDLITVVAGLLDLALEQVNGLNVLRSFRLLRVFKLAQSWPTMRLLLTIILSTLEALGNLCLILCIVIYIFAIIGLQLFRDSYVEANFVDGVPRWNFTDFYHSMLMIFRVLCGEWIEPLYDCMRATDEMCMVVFLPALVFGNFIVLNLFLALLLNAFASDSLDKHRETSSERSKLMDGIHRLKYLLCCCFTRSYGSQTSDSVNVDNICEDQVVQSNYESVDVSENSTSVKSEIKTNNVGGVSNNCSMKNTSKNYNNNSFKKKNLEIPNLPQTVKEYCEDFDKESSYISESEIIGPPPDCCPQSITSRIACLSSIPKTQFTRRWMSFRILGNKIINHKLFEVIVIIMIIASSVELAFEDIYLYQKPFLQNILQTSNAVFAILFTFEMILRWIGMGFTEYFTNLWTLLDFFIVVVSLLPIVGTVVGFQKIGILTSLRTLRSLRPLRAISRWQGMKIVVNALMNAIPAIMNVFLVCMVFWLIFSIMGVQFFKGKFFRCINSTTLDEFNYQLVPNKTMCNTMGELWTNPNVNFDNAFIGFLALFQVATFEGWMEVINHAVDAFEVDNQPRHESSPLSYLYFVVFIVFGSFFSMNLFIGVIIDNFNVLKKKYEGSYLDAFLTENQRSYYNTLKKLAKKKPQKSIKRPQAKFQLFFYNMTMSSRFEMGIMLLIFLNMIALAVSHYKETKAVHELEEMINMSMTIICTFEAIVKIIGLQYYYFRFGWNMFDLTIVILSIFGVVDRLLSNSSIGDHLISGITFVKITPTILRILHVFRMGSILRLIKAAKGIRKLLFALVISLPAIFNIGALLFLIMFMYAIIGMSLFGRVKLNGAFNEVVNFQTFGNSFMLMLRLATSAGWNDILDALLITIPNCNENYYAMPNDDVLKLSNYGDCGIPYLAIPFMVSYIIIVWLIVINMYIAVILENFNQAHEQEEVGITEDDFDMFYNVWEKYDPFASQFIKFEQLVNFVNDLEPPLQVPKPNDITLVTFNIPIMEGDKIHCLDILVALVGNLLSDVQESDELNTLKEQMEIKFAQNFPARANITVKSSTLQRKKEDVAARTLQRSWRSFKAQRAMRNITALAVQQRIRRMSNICLRSRTSVMNNLSNRINIALSQYFNLKVETRSLNASNLGKPESDERETLLPVNIEDSKLVFTEHNTSNLTLKDSPLVSNKDL